MTRLGWTTEQSALLLWLRGIWDGLYQIEDPRDNNFAWIAKRLNPADTLTGCSGQELRMMLQRDAIKQNNEMFLKDRVGQ
jgi:hypothetical protein